MLNKLVKFLTATISIILFLNVFLFLKLPGMVFYPLKNIDVTPKEWGLVYEPVSLPLKNKTKISGWYLPHPKAKKTVLFFHGNGGNISHRGDSLYIFHKLKLNVLIIDYPGYGNSEGTPSEQSLYQSANVAWQYLISYKNVNPANIIIFGRSLGGAVATELASHVNAGALILESTFSSVRDFVDIAFPALSYVMYIRYSFDSLSKINKVTSPVLMIHSPEDEVIPFVLGKKLFEGVVSEKNFLPIQGGHNDGFIKSMPSYVKTLKSFIYTL